MEFPLPAREGGVEIGFKLGNVRRSVSRRMREIGQGLRRRGERAERAIRTVARLAPRVGWYAKLSEPQNRHGDVADAARATTTARRQVGRRHLLCDKSRPSGHPAGSRSGAWRPDAHTRQDRQHLRAVGADHPRGKLARPTELGDRGAGRRSEKSGRIRRKVSRHASRSRSRAPSFESFLSWRHLTLIMCSTHRWPAAIRLCRAPLRGLVRSRRPDSNRRLSAFAGATPAVHYPGPLLQRLLPSTKSR
jgi:hypothetical protein